MTIQGDFPRRDLLKGGIALGSMAATAGMSFWSQLAMAQDEVLVPFTDVPEGFAAPPTITTILVEQAILSGNSCHSTRQLSEKCQTNIGYETSKFGLSMQ
jgi:hypothetical protein